MSELKIYKSDIKPLKTLLDKGSLEEKELLESLMRKKLKLIVARVDNESDISEDIKELKILQKKVETILKNVYGWIKPKCQS